MAAGLSWPSFAESEKGARKSCGTGIDGRGEIARVLEMDGQKGNQKQKRGTSWFGMKDVFYLTLMVLGVVATVNVAKLKRGLKEIFSPKPVVVAADQKDLFRQAEARIRAEMEEK